MSAPVNAPSAPAGVPMPAGMNQGELELINTDEKTAAVIMALVSHQTGIPLERLDFKSIRLIEDAERILTITTLDYDVCPHKLFQAIYTTCSDNRITAIYGRAQVTA